MPRKSAKRAATTHSIRDVEQCTGRRISCIFDEREAAGKFAEQCQSPLFSALPREIRDMVWAYALAPFEDPSHPYAETEYYFRPGHTARLKTDTALLRTCRRVWLEANELPMLQAEQSFYYYRPAPEARNREWLASLTSHNKRNLGHLHLYVQMCNIESLEPHAGRLRRYFLKGPAQPGDFQPRMFHVTLRHTDWWYWESEQPLRLKYDWVQSLLDTPDLRSTQIFKLELENLDYKVKQLQPILDRLRKLESQEFDTHLIDGKPAKTKFVLSEQETEYNWRGPTTINSKEYDPYANMSRLNYYVITLTWKLRFPDIPKANVPVLRRMPRLPPSAKQISPSGNQLDALDWRNAVVDNEDSEIETQLPYAAPSENRPLGKAPNDLPYAEGMTHDRAYRLEEKRQLKQQILAKKQGMPAPPPLNKQFFMLSIMRKAVFYVSGRQADDVEKKRWVEFGRQMSPLLPAKWQRQGALLKHIDADMVNPNAKT